MGYSREALKGVSWVGALRGATRGISFIRTIVLARILTPSQFGDFGIAIIVLGLIDIITETGINVFLVQEEKIDRYLHTAWIVSIIRGILIALVILVSAPFVASFFRAPDAFSLLLLISLVPFIRGFINPAIVRFQKDLAFDKEFWFRLPIFMVEFLVALFLALVTREAASLVYGFIASAILEVVLSFIAVGPRPRISFDRKSFQEVLHRGKWVTAYSALNYVFQNGDNVVVGRLLGAFELGLYRVGYQIATIPQEIVDSVSRVTFPIYTRIGGDRERLRKAFFKTVVACSLFAIPFGTLLFVFTRELVLLFLGDTWLLVVPALKVLVVFGVVRAISNVAFPLFLSVKKQKYVMVVTLVIVGGLGVTIVPLVTTPGILGAAYSAFLASLLSIPFVVYFVVRILR